MSETSLRSICVFCGASAGARPEYALVAATLGRELATRGIRIVYGGGNVGLMGILADAALAAGGEVIGVIPHALVAREVAHFGVTELKVVDSMHERKALMADLSDAFVALPGGIGTFEEFFEVLTWAQLGLHRKPCGLLDVFDYFAPLVEMLAGAVREDFLRQEHARMVLRAESPAELLAALEEYRAPDVPKWISRRET